LRYFDSDLGFGKTKSLAVNNPDSTPPADIITRGTETAREPHAFAETHRQYRSPVGGFVRHLVGEFYNEALSKQHLDTSMVLIPGHADSTQVIQSNGDSIGTAKATGVSVSDDGQAEMQTTVHMGNSNTITFGTEYLLNRVHFGATVDRNTGAPLLGSTDRVRMISNTGVYAQDELHIGNASTLVPGLRFDYHSTFGPVLSPKFGATLSPVDWLHARFSVGTASVHRL